MKNKLLNISAPKYFLYFMLSIYAGLFFFKQNIFYSSCEIFIGILVKILPFFVLIFVLMFLTNYFIKPESIIKHLSGKGSKKWILVIIGGTLSSGAIYMWYPLLAELKTKGMNYGLIACFLYNRAVKIPLLPLAIFYFGWKYILILSFVIIITSVIQGKIINKIMYNN